MDERRKKAEPQGEGLEELVALLDRLAAMGRARQRRLEQQQAAEGEGRGHE